LPEEEEDAALEERLEVLGVSLVRCVASSKRTEPSGCSLKRRSAGGRERGWPNFKLAEF
jgi:hypothetical protein